MLILARLFIFAILAVPMIFAIELGPFAYQLVTGEKGDPLKQARMRRILYVFGAVWFAVFLILLFVLHAGAAGWFYVIPLLAVPWAHVIAAMSRPATSPNTE